jgi:hypothetical protein
MFIYFTNFDFELIWVVKLTSLEGCFEGMLLNPFGHSLSIIKNNNEDKIKVRKMIFFYNYKILNIQIQFF